MQEVFTVSSRKRSEAFRAGYKEKLHRIIDEADQATFPFDFGTPEADAYLSGMEHAATYYEKM